MQRAKKKLRFTDLSNPWQRFRSQTGLSQVALAELMEMGQPAISAYESRGRFPEPIAAKRFVDLAKRYRVRMSMEEIYANLIG